MKLKGSITIYLSLIMLGMLVLICTIIEAARVKVAQTESKGFAYMAMDAVFAGYGRQLFNDYGILLVWENKELVEQLNEYMQANINKADLKDAGFELVNTNINNIRINKQDYATSQNGKPFVNQVTAYMKYAVAGNAVNMLTQRVKSYNPVEESEEKIENNDVTDIANKTSEELLALVDEINSDITHLGNTKKLKGKLAAVKQKLRLLQEDINSGSKNQDTHDKLVRKYKSKYKKLLNRLEIEQRDIKAAIDKMKQYEAKKNAVLKLYGEINNAMADEDYIIENLKVLEDINTLIQKVFKKNIIRIVNMMLGAKAPL